LRLNLPQIRPLFMQKNILKYLTVLLLSSATLFVSCDKKAGDNKTTTTTADSSATKVAEAQPADTTKTDTLAAAAEKKEPVGGGQGSNYGYINSLELLSKMPEIKAAERKLEALAKQKEASFKAYDAKIPRPWTEHASQCRKHDTRRKRSKNERNWRTRAKTTSHASQLARRISRRKRKTLRTNSEKSRRSHQKSRRRRTLCLYLRLKRRCVAIRRHHQKYLTNSIQKIRA
jgi:hypothetical protein